MIQAAKALWTKFPMPEPQVSFRERLLEWARPFPFFAFLDSCHSEVDRYGEYDFLLAVAGNEARILHDLTDEHISNWLFGWVSYEFRRTVEPKLSAGSPPFVDAGIAGFFIPETILLKKRGEEFLEIESSDAEGAWKEILAVSVPEIKAKKVVWNSVLDRDEYIRKVGILKNYIRDGDIYEINLCREFRTQETPIDPVEFWIKLTAYSPVPFAACIRLGEKYLLSASPERFLKHIAGKLVSQPIKGTISRAKNAGEDERYAEQLKNSEKNQAENVMIVDLVRNDLYRSCDPHSVKVDRMFELQTFPQVHHLVSTISGILSNQVSAIQAFRNAFPPGSMTGAPKYRAMELINQVEPFSRGIYSGVCGYVKPGGDFDFSVVIRSLVFDEEKVQGSFHVGGAITWDSVAEDEFEETNWKAAALLLASD